MSRQQVSVSSLNNLQHFLSSGGGVLKERLDAKAFQDLADVGQSCLKNIFNWMPLGSDCVAEALDLLDTHREEIVAALTFNGGGKGKADVDRGEKDCTHLQKFLGVANVGLPYLAELDVAIGNADPVAMLAAVGWSADNRQTPLNKDRFGACAAAYACMYLKYRPGVWTEAYNIVRADIIDVAFRFIDEVGVQGGRSEAPARRSA